MGVNNFGVEGILAQFTYTFASPKDASIGVAQPAAVTPVSGGDSGCFIGTALYGSPMARDVKGP